MNESNIQISIEKDSLTTFIVNFEFCNGTQTDLCFIVRSEDYVFLYAEELLNLTMHYVQLGFRPRLWRRGYIVVRHKNHMPVIRMQGISLPN